MIKQYYYTENIIINDENKVINTKLNKELGEIENEEKEANELYQKD